MPPAKAVTASRPPLTAWRDWRSWPDSLASLWRRSLRFRTILVTLALTALAILVACIWMALAIQNDLFQARKDQVLADSLRATQAAQATLDAAAVQGDTVQIQNLMTQRAHDARASGPRPT